MLPDSCGLTLAVAETGSTSAAAQAVYISQSTLTLAIQQLEQEIGVSQTLMTHGSSSMLGPELYMWLGKPYSYGTVPAGDAWKTSR